MFVTQLEKRVDAIGFVGHSLVYGEQHPTSIGLCFAPSAPNTTTNCTVTPDFGLLKAPAGTEYTIKDKFPTNAKVIFIGVCDVGPIFESLWNITATTKGQALIVPTTGDVLLGNAAVAWQVIAQALAQGNTVQAAVAQGNAYIQQNGRSGRWMVIGDGNVTIRPSN